ncbi:MAG: hypothetical protein ABI041_16025 [Bdellovibrionia bacterium]
MTRPRRAKKSEIDSFYKGSAANIDAFVCGDYLGILHLASNGIVAMIEIHALTASATQGFGALVNSLRSDAAAEGYKEAIIVIGRATAHELAAIELVAASSVVAWVAL